MTFIVPLLPYMQMQCKTKSQLSLYLAAKNHLLCLLDVTLWMPRQYGCLLFLISTRTKVYIVVLQLFFLAVSF